MLEPTSSPTMLAVRSYRDMLLSTIGVGACISPLFLGCSYVWHVGVWPVSRLCSDPYLQGWCLDQAADRKEEYFTRRDAKSKRDGERLSCSDLTSDNLTPGVRIRTSRKAIRAALGAAMASS